MRPPSIGNAGKRLNSTRKTFTDMTLANRLSDVGGQIRPMSSLPVAKSTAARIAAMTTFTAGPAAATTNSSSGRSGIRCKRATPPMGKSVMSRVGMP
jgi:hypothetical protein